MKNHRRAHILIAVLLVLLLKSVFLLIFDKEEIHLAVNSWNGSFRDRLFFYLTWAGDGMFALFTVVFLLFVRFRYSILVSLSYLSSAIVVQSMKHLFFSETMRPVRHFRDTVWDLHLVDGVDHHSYLSFPSGHSASAFAVFIAVALLLKNRLLGIFFVIMATGIAFSRVYLSQHFLGDTLVGGFLGFLAAYLFFRWQKNWKAKWLDKSFLSNKSALEK